MHKSPTFKSNIGFQFYKQKSTISVQKNASVVLFYFKKRIKNPTFAA
jgi:hypothetical protein